VLAKCVECMREFEMADPHPGDLIECPHCETKMKVVSVNVNRVYLETVDEEDLEDLDVEGEVETP
jgi:DNA-directed RNA polymerase subunit RPC12/RpoP